MVRWMSRCSIAMLAVFLLCTGMYRQTGRALFLALAITAATVAYHLLMRLAVGFLLDRLPWHRVEPDKGWFARQGWEPALYRTLKVKGWKAHLPTADAAQFDLTHRTPRQVAQSMCQAEVIHEVIVPLSFVPVLAIPFLGEPLVFWLTSVGASLFDLCFAVIQRFNRPRILRLAGRKTKETT